MRIDAGAGEPLLVERAEQLEGFQQSLIAASRGTRTDWASRFILPPVEEFATLQLLETNVRPTWLMWSALGLTLGGAAAFAYGWLATGLILLVLSTPLDIIGRRLAAVRLRPLPARMLSRRALWPAAGLALFALGWWEARFGSGWGALVSAGAAVAFAEAMRIEQNGFAVPGEVWLLSRRNAVFSAIPFAIAGAWTGLIVFVALYAAASFFYVQHVRHLGPS